MTQTTDLILACEVASHGQWDARIGTDCRRCGRPGTTFMPFMPTKSAGINGTNGAESGTNEEQHTQVIRLDQVAVERVTWLWPGRLPLGKLVVIDGDPSVGKSTLAVDLAARVTRVKAWPDGVAADRNIKPGVLLLSAEDGLADTIRPRLEAAGANLCHVHALPEVLVRHEDDGRVEAVPPSLPRDIPLLRRVIETRGISLVVVDVLMAYLSGRVDSHRDQDVRGVLHQLAAMAEQTRCSVLLVRHLNKAPGGNPLYRGGGSIGIVGAARAAYLVARDPEDPERRVIACTKSNLAAEPPALAYRLVDSPNHGCARIEWEGVVDLSASQLLRSHDDTERSERDDAVEWLVGYLSSAGGSAKAADVLKAARTDGVSERTLHRARKRANVGTQRTGFGGGSIWFLAGHPPPTLTVV